MPHHAVEVRGSEDAALTERLAALRAELDLPGGFAAPVLAEAEESAAAVLASLGSDAERVDLTAVPFVTVDPSGSTDLDQALHIAAAEDGRLTVRYAIADVPAFVAPEGEVDREARRRGQTVYLPDGRVPLHPEVLSEGAASLLPDVDRPAFVWTFTLAVDGAVERTALVRSRVRSRAQLTYEQVQAFLDSADAPEAAAWPEELRASIALLPEVGRRRTAQEVARGGASLNMPDQEIHVVDGRYEISQRIPLPAEDHNAQLSLMTGMEAARIMLDGGVGVLRTMPAPDAEAVAAFRARTRALGHPWEEGADYGAYLRTVDPREPRHLAVLHAATSLFRGAGYTAFDAEAEDPALRALPADPEQAALAAPYAHATAPLRRLVDRFVLAVCHALVSGAPVPAWARRALPELPALMQDAGRRASAADRAAGDLVEAAELSEHVGAELEGVVVRSGGESADVQLAQPPVAVRVPAAAEPGTRVRIRIDAVDVASGKVTASGVDWPHSSR
ncbi:RNB domain-containing ribonuclease [Micrococcus sp. EYE_162]|uniref:RNB domain-containing ribonuclease n=1 Tax=unclassified Micrococcus TaxID=2620948 RepID=UPI0020048E83|nr:MULTISPECIES: RNB domain-containing ribonuclease [unclassified Micrococcus]MCK6095981.1 RNB domain-containing ribonuclease [Micrococcus sp. EYE_212]MCK6172072.1 RNB domain-containing ribonuclease [Micrococcus sp. EYE_162]